MIKLQPHPEGVILGVRAQPNARRSQIRGQSDGLLRVSVTQPPEKGKANKALVAALARWLYLPRSQVELVAGHSLRYKRFLIRGLSVEKLQALIEQRLRKTAEEE